MLCLDPTCKRGLVRPGIERFKRRRFGLEQRSWRRATRRMIVPRRFFCVFCVGRAPKDLPSWRHERLRR